MSFSRRDSGIQHTNSLSISDAHIDGGQLFDIIVELQAQQAAHEAQQAAAHEAQQAQNHAQQAANQEQQNVRQAQWAAHQAQLAEFREVQAAHRAQLLGFNAVNQDTLRQHEQGKRISMQSSAGAHRVVLVSKQSTFRFD